MYPLDEPGSVKYYSFYPSNTIWLLKNKENIMKIIYKIDCKGY